MALDGAQPKGDLAVVGEQIGRPARALLGVVARCARGLPSVAKTAPHLADGTPFPTLYWLTCPAARAAIGGLEAGGLMRELNARLESDAEFAAAYVAAHESYLAAREELGAIEGRPGAGGMPRRVKCLHVHYAHHAAGGPNPVGALVAQRIEPLNCAKACVDGARAEIPEDPRPKVR
ncbi:MAG: DUF501 domain-containing protein [Actinomycetota bacterium]